MNSIIELDSGKIAGIVQKMTALRDEVESLRTQLGGLESALDNDLYDLRQSAGEEMTEGISTISSKPRVKLREQREKLDSFIFLLNSAADLTDSTDNKLQQQVEKFKVALKAMFESGSVESVVASAASISGLSISASIGYISSREGFWTDLEDKVQGFTHNLNGVLSNGVEYMRLKKYMEEYPESAAYIESLRESGLGDKEIYSICQNSGAAGLQQNAKWYANTTAYVGNDKVNFKMKNVSDGDYSNYNVVKGFKTEYVLKQKNNVQCTATADVMAGSIAKGEKQTVVDSRDWCSQGAKWTFTKSIGGGKDTVEEQCRTIYNQILEGTPVVVRVNGHSVLAVGLKQGVDSNNVQPSDILIVDPGDGKVKTAAQIYYGHTSGKNLTMYDKPGWGLRIPK